MRSEVTKGLGGKVGVVAVALEFECVCFGALLEFEKEFEQSDSASGSIAWVAVCLRARETVG